MNDLFKNNSYIDYSVLTLKSANYKEIKDVDEKIIGFYVDDKYTDTAQKALDKSISAEYVGYSSINELKNALISNEIDAMLIMSSYLEALDNSNDEGELENISDEQLNNIENFDNESKVLYTFKVKIDNSKKTKKIDLEKGSFAIYISGQDSYASSVSETSRSDVNLLMVVNLKTKQILLVSIPRDYYIKISSKGAYDKLTHISLFGSEEASKSLGDVLDVSIDYYVKFNFTTFMEAVEYLLPLDVYSDYDFTTSVYDQTIGNSYTFSKGYNHITDGKMALQFVRARKNFAEGDRQRGINQSRFLRAVIKKASSPSILLKYNKILKALEGTFLTNISDDSIREIAKYVIDNNGEFKINSMSLGGSDASRATYSGGSRPLYVMIPDNSSIEDAKVQIKTVLDGGVPDIQEDASELADVSKTHTVTSKDIGKSYGYSNGYSGSSSKNNVIVDNKENEENVYYTGKQLPIYKVGKTTWYVDEEGIISLEVGDKIYGNGKIVKSIKIKAEVIESEEYIKNKAKVRIEVIYEGKLENIIFNKETITNFEKEENRYIVEREVTENGIYEIEANGENGAKEKISIEVNEVENLNNNIQIKTKTLIISYKTFPKLLSFLTTFSALFSLETSATFGSTFSLTVFF